MLKIEHLTKLYGEKKAVDDLSLHIEKGEIYGFIGHNGAGKTTTIKACCGILQFDSGEIWVDGVSVRDDPLSCKRKIAYIPDSPQKPARRNSRRNLPRRSCCAGSHRDRLPPNRSRSCSGGRSRSRRRIR